MNPDKPLDTARTVKDIVKGGGKKRTRGGRRLEVTGCCGKPNFGSPHHLMSNTRHVTPVSGITPGSTTYSTAVPMGSSARTRSSMLVPPAWLQRKYHTSTVYFVGVLRESK